MKKAIKMTFERWHEDGGYREVLMVAGKNWLRVFLDTNGEPTLAPNGFGSRVIVTAEGRRYHRYIDGCSGYLTQSELSAHFGLGENEVVSELRIEWANGTVTTLSDIPVNQTITVKAGAVDSRVYLSLIQRTEIR